MSSDVGMAVRYRVLDAVADSGFTAREQIFEDLKVVERLLAGCDAATFAVEVDGGVVSAANAETSKDLLGELFSNHHRARRLVFLDRLAASLSPHLRSVVRLGHVPAMLRGGTDPKFRRVSLSSPCSSLCVLLACCLVTSTTARCYLTTPPTALPMAGSKTTSLMPLPRSN